MSFLGVVSDVLSFLLEKGDSGEILDQTQLEPATPGIYIYMHIQSLCFTSFFYNQVELQFLWVMMCFATVFAYCSTSALTI